MGSFRSFDGTRISYDAEGDGPAVVLLHGYASESFINWVRPGITAKLAGAGYRAIAMDLRGHGMSDKPHEPEAYADGAMVKDTRALLDHLDISKCFIVGFSMGAMNTARLLIEGEARVAAAVLAGVGANLLSDAARGSAIADAMLTEDKSTITNPVAKSFRDFADLTRADRKALAAVMSQPRGPIQGVEAIAIPILVLGAEGDPLAGDPAALAGKIGGARSATVPGTHLNVVNNPEFHRELIRFLDEHRALVSG